MTQEFKFPRVLPRMIMKGCKGREVSAIQEALISYGYRIKADGAFGPATQSALRSFQTHKGLFPSGVIDQDTVNCFYALNEPPAVRRDTKMCLLPALHDPVLSEVSRPESATMIRAQSFPWMASAASRPVSLLSLSSDGFRFIYKHETWVGISERLHFPGGNSGVTIGPGYDMRDRKSAAIEADLTAIGVDPVIAKKLSAGATLTDKYAKAFVSAHKKDVTLTPHQQMLLLKLIAPHYEAIVKRHITIDLFQFEYDALVCFVYNPGASFVPVAHDINSGYVANAMKTIRSRIGKVKSIQKGLLARRNDEIALFMYGNYGRLPNVS